MLKTRGVKHVVLNAKHHEREAEIVAQAGRIGAVTIATNMAGRGTDILLGGNPEFLAASGPLAEQGLKPGATPDDEYEAAFEGRRWTANGALSKVEHDKVVELGGLHILGTERHESRRIDNQLRGRAGRQGDPGASRFYLSLDDDLMRIFAGDKMKAAMKKLGMEEDVPIESPMVSRAIERAQKQVEQRNFEIRKHLLEYDDVNNKQRTEIYSLRAGCSRARSRRSTCWTRRGTSSTAWSRSTWRPTRTPRTGRSTPSCSSCGTSTASTEQVRGWTSEDPRAGPDRRQIWEQLLEAATRPRKRRSAPEMMRQYERHILLQIIDGAWKDHLLAMDHLKEGIGLRAYGQKDPLVEYKRESFEMFGQIKERIENEATRFLFLLEPMTEEEREQRGGSAASPSRQQIFAAASRSAAGVDRTRRRQDGAAQEAKVGRNDPCPCGSGKKFKKCHGGRGGRGLTPGRLPLV